jgi:hypothetical protein
VKRLAVALLLCAPAYAGPLANCDSGKCWMAEADYKKLQDFHRQSRKSAELMQAHIAEQELNLIRLLGQLRACSSRLPEKET